MSSTKILITGATGFVGSHLVRLLLDQDAHIIASTFSNSKKGLQDVANRLTFHQADIGNFTDVLRMVQAHSPEIIFHIAAMRGPQCDADPEAGIQSNVLGTYHILEAARMFGVKRLSSPAR